MSGTLSRAIRKASSPSPRVQYGVASFVQNSLICQSLDPAVFYQKYRCLQDESSASEIGEPRPELELIDCIDRNASTLDEGLESAESAHHGASQMGTDDPALVIPVTRSSAA